MTIHERFFKMEEEERLFSLQLTDGTFYWDIIRRDVFAAVNSMEKGLLAYAQPEFKITVATRLKDIIKISINEFTLNYLRKRKSLYIFMTVQRQKKGDELVDYVSDHLYDLVSEDSVCIEHTNKSSISYLDMFIGRDTRIPPVNIRIGKKDAEIVVIGKEISIILNKYFGFSLNVCAIINYPIRAFKETRKYYRRLFAINKPKAIVCNNDGSLKGLYFAAREACIPCLELQHGASPRSILWTYPKTMKNPGNPGLTLPTAFLTFSKYWAENIEYPVKCKSSIGNNNLYQNEIEGGNDTVIISNIMCNELFINLLIALECHAISGHIYFKLHPQQFRHKNKTINKLRNVKNVTIITDEMDFCDLFKCCKHVIGVRSTLIYLALQAGKNIYLYKRSNYNWDEEVLKYVNLFDNAKELSDLIKLKSVGKCCRKKTMPLFFQRFDPNKFRKVLECVNDSM